MIFNLFISLSKIDLQIKKVKQFYNNFDINIDYINSCNGQNYFFQLHFKSFQKCNIIIYFKLLIVVCIIKNDFIFRIH